MPQTEAMLGYGSTLELAPYEHPNAFEYVSEAKNFTPPSDTTDQQDVTHMQSPNKTREFIDGLTDPGEMSFEVNLVPGSRTDRLLIAAKGKRKRARITFPNGVQVLFTGSRQSYERSAETEGPMTASVSFKVSGDPIQTPPTAPRALVAPVLSASVTPPEIGAPIELDQGIWAGAMSWAIKWQRSDTVDGAFTDITDAEGAAYVPVAADEGKFIRAQVVASNPDFQTTVATEALAAAVVDPNEE